jgi:23S rRNA (cytosine1962-C5)-methyltransferase
LKNLKLKKGKEKSLERFHPWIFSGALEGTVKNVEEGELVRLFDASDNFRAIGHFQPSSLSIRILSFEDVEIDQSFWNKKIEKALETRLVLNFDETQNQIFRLTHGEGDGLPGLIIDVYGELAIIQCHSLGMFNHIEEISKAIEIVFGDKISTIYSKSQETIPFLANAQNANRFLKGEAKNIWAAENGLLFFIDYLEGQKTGFFIDQRENRELLGKYSKGKTVCNTFCYSGGFSLYALQHGAKKVVSVDSSERAMELVEKNLANNFKDTTNHESVKGDVFKYFAEKGDEKFDVMVLDPPAFAKHQKAVPNALKGYRRLNAAGMRNTNNGGIIFTFSCSQAITKENFRTSIFAAAIEANKEVKILHQLHQPADHPINIFHPEGEYLKGLVIQVFDK